MKLYEFIVNPQARSGLGMLTWNTLEPELKKRRSEYRLYLTERKKHAEKIAAQITADGQEHCIVVLGGDGTVNEVINGILDPGKVTLGYIPIGSSNDFARGLKLPVPAEKALEAILNPEGVVQIDLGVLEKNGERRRFAVSAGMGFDAAVCHEVCVSRWKRILNRFGMGKLTYAVVALDRLIKDKPVRMTIRTDDGTEKTFERTYFAAFMNLPFEGGGFKFCPEASPEDGMLDVVVAHDLTPLKILFLLPLALLGKHTGFREVTIFRCRRAGIFTEKPLALHTDGEPEFPRKAVAMEISGERLSVIGGPKAAANRKIS